MNNHLFKSLRAPICCLLLAIYSSGLTAEPLQEPPSGCPVGGIFKSTLDFFGEVDWKSPLIYAGPFFVSYLGCAALTPIKTRIKSYPNGIHKSAWVSIYAVSSWALTTVLRPLFKPPTDIVDEKTKDFNALISTTFSSVNKPESSLEVAHTNQYLTDVTNSMNTDYSIHAQLMRAVIERTLLYVKPTLMDADLALHEGNEELAISLLASAMVYLRLLNAETLPHSKIFEEFVAPDFAAVSHLFTKDFRESLLHKIEVYDPYFRTHVAGLYYKSLLDVFGIRDERVDSLPAVVAADNSSCQATDNSSCLNETVDSSCEKEWVYQILHSQPEYLKYLENIIKYSPGLITHVMLSILENSFIGGQSIGLGVKIEQMIVVIRITLVVTLSDSLNKYLESIIQKWLFQTKNSHISSDPTTQQINEEYQQSWKRTPNLYSYNAQNGRANLGRAVAFVGFLAAAARKSFQGGDEGRAALYIADAASFLRRTHKEISPNDPFITMAVAVHLSEYQLGLESMKKVHERLLLIENKSQTNNIASLAQPNVLQPHVQDYYQKLFDNWNIIRAE